MEDKNVLVLVLGLVILFALVSFSNMNNYGMMGMMYGYNFGMGLVGWIFMLLLIAALILLILWVIQNIQVKK